MGGRAREDSDRRGLKGGREEGRATCFLLKSVLSAIERHT